MKKIAPLLTIILLCLSYYSFSQVGIGTTNPDPSSILEIESQTQGFLPPRMTQAERDLIASPAEGLFVYNTDSHCFQYYNGTTWSGCLGEAQLNKLNCGAISANGIYFTGASLTASNTISIEVVVNTLDTYTISTNTVNGYSFSASGAFPTIGLNTITLSGTGTPIATQTDTFTIDFVGTGFTCNVDVNVLATPLANCLEYLNTGSSTSGIYTIDPDGVGGSAPYDCYCDMTNDGGGWTLVFVHDTSGGYWSGDVEASEYNMASPSLTTTKYSILSRLDDIKSNAAYEFRLHYPTSGLTNHWSQTFDPRSGSSSTRPVAGYTAISVSMTNSLWGGLENSGSNTYLDGSVNSGTWFYSIGSVNSWGGGIPGSGSAVSSVQLFIR